MWRDEDGGPTSKHTGAMKRRRKHRLILHKSGRRMADSDIAEQLRELLPHEDLFVCRNCGHVSQEVDRCSRTGECVYC
jgi:hypothetical protein